MAEIDLNLLAVFDALFELRSVTRAAARLNLTQSAVSHALRRLRETVDDPLFVRSGGGLQPTPRARAMAPGVIEGLARMRAAMLPVTFDPMTAMRSFTLAAGTYFCALLLPQLVARARAVAPAVTFRIVPLGPALETELDRGDVDLALGAFDRVPPRLRVETLFREELVWIAARRNPIAAAALSSDELLRQPHLVIATQGRHEPPAGLLASGPLEAHWRNRAGAGQDRFDRVPAIVYDALTATLVVAGSDAIALVPGRLARAEAERLDLRIIGADETQPGLDLGMLIHERALADPGVAWLRAEVRELTR